ncbi:hypothetical protein N9J01_00415 [bacterium]|nr:hypothetical protein [bacterium]
MKLNVVDTVDTKIKVKRKKIMSKMRIFKFWNENGDEKEKEAISLKKAVRSVQGDYKDKFISVEYITKKGKNISQSIEIPMGRKIRQAAILEKKRAALKAAREAGR